MIKLEKMPQISQKHKRISKNKKKNWRKHSDVKDVEEHLEDVRLEERIGGPASAKSDDVLFFVDKTQIENKKPIKKATTEVPVQFRCYRYLEPAPFPEPCTKPSVRKPPSKEKALLVKKRLLHKQAKRKARLREAPKETPVPRNEWAPDHDLWDAKAEKQPSDDYAKDGIEFSKKLTKIKPPKVPKMRFYKPSVLSAVEVPHPGASYNPMYEDYQDLVSKATTIEERKKKEEEHLDRVLTKMFPTKAEAPTPATWLTEMSQGLQIESALPESESSEDDDEAEVLPNPTIRAERKLSSKRRRQERQLMMEKQLQKCKEFRKQQNEIYRLKGIMNEIKQAEKQTEEQIQKRKEKEEMKLSQPATLSKYKYEPPDLEVCTVNELAGSLRLLKPQGCLSEDRIKSFQRRNIIETRIRQFQKRKYKLKRFFKKGHKDEELEQSNDRLKRMAIAQQKKRKTNAAANRVHRRKHATNATRQKKRHVKTTPKSA